MLEHITIGQIATILTFVVSVLSAITYLKNNIKNWVQGASRKELEDIHKELKDLDKQLKKMNRETIKNFLTAMLAGIEHGAFYTEIDMERFWDQYEKYTKLGGNSYIKKRVERLQKEGKL